MINFEGLRVLTLESRRATELATLVTTFGGRVLGAPALRELPLASNTAAIAFVRRMVAGDFDIVIFLTGVGARVLLEVAEHAGERSAFIGALSRAKVVVRGPKPLAVLREVKVPIWAAAAEPNTWKEVVSAIRAQLGHERLDGVRVAVQEYGVSNLDLLEELRSQGADVTPVPVYKWALPEDVQPLRDAVAAIVRGDVDVVLFMTSMQLVHLWQIVTELGLEAEARRQMQRMVLASIGPSTSAELRRHGFEVDLEASHPRLGVLVREAAERSAELLHAKRQGPGV